MVLQKRLEYGFNGYQVPPTPRAPRSARRRVSSGKKNEDNTRMCAFDLLATVAGNLLQEGGDTSANKLKENPEKVIGFNFKTEEQQKIEENVNICDQGSSNRSFFVSEIISQAPLHDTCSRSVSGITVCTPKSVNGESKKLDFSAEKVKVPFGCKVDDANNKQMSGKTQVVNNVNLVTRDDDENSSGRTQLPYATIRSNDEVHLGTEAELKPIYRNRKTCHKWQRSLRDYPLKKRRLYDLENVSNCDGVVSSIDNGFKSSRKEFYYGSSFGAQSERGTGTSGISRTQIPAFQATDYVKLKIKSFMVPELFIEIPETATVDSLKGTVMEAMTTILSGELHVGVMLQGKKIRDDNKTLLQTGICHDNNEEALSFILEPNEKDDSVVLPSPTPKPLTRYFPAPGVTNKVVKREVCDVSPDHPMTNLNFVESDHDSASSPSDMSTDNKSVSSSRALVRVPPVNTGALAIVPVRKSKRSEVVQRRIRRPFSVSEVEALVQAVEKLGTGRWRDVKLRAFEYAKHRTYVDLKDKWKTLVHTARISPQQRRGEPVPQELLDRVLAAHAYWSHHQAKHQFKQYRQPETCRLL